MRLRFGRRGIGTDPEAMCRPSPLEPPVTTATLPSVLNIDLKSSSLTSASADIVNVCQL